MQATWPDGDSPRDRCCRRWSTRVRTGNERRNDRSHGLTGGTVPSPTARWDGYGWRCPLLSHSSAVVPAVAHGHSAQVWGVGPPGEALLGQPLSVLLVKEEHRPPRVERRQLSHHFGVLQVRPHHQKFCRFRRASAP